MSILELKDVHKDFSGLKVLFGINLALEQGERHAIIGPNGAGKSTIFNLITGKYTPSRGKIFYKGEDITGHPPYKVARLGLARSFQITNIFRTMTVFENVRNAILAKNRVCFHIFSRLAKMDGIEEETERLLAQIGLLERKNELAGELAHGHQRSLEVGLTLASDPELILLDEPTAGMSTEETLEAIKLIDRVTKGKTLVVVEHDMEVVFSLADKITVIYYGKVLASGPPEEIRDNQQVKDAYLGEEKK